MTTTQTTTPNVALINDTFIGAVNTHPFNPESRQAVALRDRLNGMTWREVADANGYRSANVAEHNVMRFVAWLNNGTTPRIASAAGMSLRSFGVEIEFTRITMAAAARAIGAALGETVETRGYHSRGYDAWKVESDGSVTSNGRGGEAVSPILSGPEGIAQIKVVVDALRAAGAGVDRRTGIHVHIDARDLTGEQIARLMCAYVDRQGAFDRMVSPSRVRGNYCMPMPGHEKDAHDRELKAVRAPYSGGTRYRTVNVTSLHRTGTVEFRQHQGSLNATKIGAWVKMLLAMSAAVVATADEDLPHDAAELLAALTSHGLDTAAARSLTNRLR